MKDNQTVRAVVKDRRGRRPGFSPIKATEDRDLMRRPVVSRVLEIMSCLNNSKSEDPYVERSRNLINSISLGDLRSVSR